MITNSATEKILPALRAGEPAAVLQALDTLQLLGQSNLRAWFELRKLCASPEDAVAFRAASVLAALYTRGRSPAMQPIVRLAPQLATSASGAPHAFARDHQSLFLQSFADAHPETEDATAEQYRQYWRPLLLECGGNATGVLAALLSKDSAAADFALRVLSEIGPAAVDARLAIQELHDNSEASGALRLRACLALARVAPGRSKATTLAVLEFLRSPDPAVRQQAIEALHGTGEHIDAVVSALCESRGDESTARQRSDSFESIAGCLQSLGPAALPPLIRTLSPEFQARETESEDNRSRRARALHLASTVAGHFGSAALPRLFVDCPRADLAERSLVSQTAGAVIAAHPDELEAQIAWAGTQSARQQELVQALAHTPRLSARLEQEVLQPFLLRLLHSHPEPIALRLGAIRALAPRLNEELVDELLPMLSDSDFRVREACVQALGVAGPTARRAIQPLMQLLKDEAIEVRGAAATALALVSPDAAAMFPDLMSAFHLRGAADSSNGNGNGDRPDFHFLKHLSDKLASSDSRIVERTLEKVEALGHRGLSLLPALQACLRHSDIWVRSRTVKILMGYGELARELLQDVLALTDDPDWFVRQLVMQCLAALGGDASVCDRLVQAMHGDAHADVRKEAARSLGLLGATAVAAAPELVRVLADPERAELQQVAARSLDQIKAASGTDMNAALLKDEHENTPDHSVRLEQQVS